MAQLPEQCESILLTIALRFYGFLRAWFNNCKEIDVIYILMPGLNGVLSIGVPFYILLLVTMAWRAISRVQFFGDLWTWNKLCSCVGSISFLISDTLLGFNYFYSPIPHAQISIMLTYYAAQLGIALSAVESKDNNKPIELKR